MHDPCLDTNVCKRGEVSLYQVREHTLLLDVAKFMIREARHCQFESLDDKAQNTYRPS